MKVKSKNMIMILIVLGISICISVVPLKAATSKWDKLLMKYQNDDQVNQLIFVKYKKKSSATLYMYEKINQEWKLTLKCSAYVGKRGIGKKKEGDMKTPTGVYQLTSAFGIKKNPGSKLPYTKIKSYHYWCGDKKYYNTMVDVRKKKHKCVGEHLVKVKPQYNYSLVLNYNAKQKFKKGSGIFLHCTKPGRKYTAGCIAVKEQHMKEIMRKADKTTRICIFS